MPKNDHKTFFSFFVFQWIKDRKMRTKYFQLFFVLNSIILCCTSVEPFFVISEQSNNFFRFE